VGEYGLKLDAAEAKAAAFFAAKCRLHEKGIKLNCVRRWLGTRFDGVSDGAVEGRTWVTGFGQIRSLACRVWVTGEQWKRTFGHSGQSNRGLGLLVGLS